MQIMPATANWTAKKIGLPYTPALITDRDTNLRLGNAYLKLVLDDVGGSQAMAAAAYNAGPGRPRKWREGPVLDAAIWVENIPFAETRDYVKKVLSNSTLLRRPARWPQHDDPLAPRPHHRPARPERAAARKRPALRRPRGSARIGRPATRRSFLSRRVQDPRPRRDRLRRPQRLRKAGRALGRRRRQDPRRDAASRRGRATSSCCRRSRSRSATSTTTRRWRGCCATPTR